MSQFVFGRTVCGFCSGEGRVFSDKEKRWFPCGGCLGYGDIVESHTTMMQRRERYVTGVTKEIADRREAGMTIAPTRANEVQVGGDHYKKAGVFQHWDFVHDNAIPYLIGNCTKYLSRWRDKNGMQDLEKALHYAVKFREKMAERWEPCPRVSTDALLRFAEAYDLDPQAETATILLCRYRSMEDLDGAVRAIERLIARNKK